MSHFSGKKIAGVFLSSVGLLAGSIGYATTLQDQMRQAVEAAWSQDGSQPVGDFALPGLDNAVAMHNIKAVADSIEFLVSAKAECSAFTLDNGGKLVINLKNTVAVLDDAALKAVNHHLVKSISAYVSSVQPEIASRLVIEFTESAGFYEVEENGKVAFLIQPKSEMLASKMAGSLGQAQGLTLSFTVESPAASIAPKLQLSKESSVKFENMESQLKSIMAKAPIDRVQDGTSQEPMKSVGKARIDYLGFSKAFDAASDNATNDDSSFVEAGQDDDASFVAPAEPAVDTEANPEPKEASTEEKPAVEEGATPETTEEVTPESAPETQVEIAPVTSGANSDFSSKLKKIEGGEETDTTSVVLTDSSSESVEAKSPLAMDTTKPRFVGDPLEQLVNVDFREMELSNVVALLAHKAGINVIAGTDLAGVVTANLRNVTLRRAMEEALRMNGLGLVEDGGIYRIVSFKEKMSTDRVQEIIQVNNGIAKDIAKILEAVIKGSLEAPYISITANDQKNVLIVSGPKARIDELRALANQMDVAVPKMQTATEIFKLNYAKPDEIAKIIKDQLSEQGKVGVDARARQIIVTDEPAILDRIALNVKALDMSVKQVVIEALIVDITLKDDAQTGVSWVLDAVRKHTQSGTIGGSTVTGQPVGSLQNLGLSTAPLALKNAAGALNFGLLTSNIDWSGIIQAEVLSGNGRLYSNPVLITMENMPAKITIADEIPYVEFKQTNQGGQATNTEFKEIGTVMEVTPRVTHNNDIINTVQVKESTIRGELNGIPIEAKREEKSEVRTGNGQTVFMGGLRKNNHDITVRKVPILGDIPGVNVLFRQNQHLEAVNELMVFMTNTVLDEELPTLTDYQREKLESVESAPMKVNGQNSIIHDTIYPSEMRDPAWKFRRSE